MKNKLLTIILLMVLTMGLLAGCAEKNTAGSDVKLDPDQPVTLTIWHYYNGAQQAAFDDLVSRFNATTGKDMGIYVEGYSKGSVADLENAITDSISGVVGAENLPSIFSTYADTAYSAQKEGVLADLSSYFTEEELGEYIDSYISEGYFFDDSSLYLFPVAKSTEIFMMDETDWMPFAEATGSKLEELATTEGVVEVAKRYYEWTDAQTPDIADDGKAFYGRDSMSNYFIIGMKQMGIDIFDEKDGEVTIHAEKEQIKRLWDCYYVPYIKGYFAEYGKFRSDDVKTGDLLAYTGSSSSATYFPSQVELENESKPIDYVILPAPVMKDGDPYVVQQGAGMAVTKSDPEHEYAASVFLKWFTETENNLRFVCESSYLPVRKDANDVTRMDKVIKEEKLEVNEKAYHCLKTVIDELDSVELYTPKCFENGYNTRKVLDFNLSDKAKADKEAIDIAVASGISREEATAAYLLEDNFEEWYDIFVHTLNDKAAGK